MTTETAIIQLKNRAEIAWQNAQSGRTRNEAQELENICNAIIDYYNRTENLQKQVNNLHEIILLLSEYIGISSTDEPILHNADAKFLRHRLRRQMFDFDRADLTSRTLWHFVLTDWKILCGMIESIRDEKEMLSYINKILSERNLSEENVVRFYNHRQSLLANINEMQAFIDSMQH